MKRSQFLKISLLTSIASKFNLLSNKQKLKLNTIIFYKESGESHSILGFIDDGLQYISLSNLANVLPDRYFMNEVRKKLVFVKNNQRITFTVDNTFLKIDENFYQLFYPPKYIKNEVWLPVEEFVDIMSEFSSIHLYFNKLDKSLKYESKGYTVTGIEVDKRSNGAVIQILTTKRFKRTDIKHVIRNGRLHVTIRGATLNEKGYSNIPKIGVIRDVKAHQLEVKKTDGTFSYTGELVFNILGKAKRDDISISLNDENDNIIISLHTKMSVKEKETVKEEENLSKVEDQLIEKYGVDTIVIDPGHGGRDPGAVGKLSRKRRLYEKTVALDIAIKLKKMLLKKQPGINVVLTRPDDRFIHFTKRGIIANKNKGKLFVSIHCNGNKSSRANGFEVYILGNHKDEAARKVAMKENEVLKFENVETQKRFEGLSLIIATMKQKAYLQQSLHVAESVSRTVGAKLQGNGIKNRGVKQAGFYVLYGPSMPSILIETAFISNKHEVKVLASKSERTKIAMSLSKGILDYKRDIERSI